MKEFFSILCLFIFSFGLTACANSETNESNETNQEEMPSSDLTQETRESDMSDPSMMIDLNITIGDQVFSAKLYDNQTTQSFIEKLPLNINMSDVNSNEKFYSFPDSQQIPRDLGILMQEISCCMEIMVWYCFMKPSQVLIATLLSDILRRQYALLNLSETVI
jgi:hypothetical protein